MKRGKALQISDRLVQAGQTHSVVVGVQDGYVPRESYTVNIKQAMSFAAFDVTKLANVAAEIGCQIVYCGGVFTFTETTAYTPSIPKVEGSA